MGTTRVYPSPEQLQALRALRPGDRVRYQGWRGPEDSGEGVFCGFLYSTGTLWIRRPGEEQQLAERRAGLGREPKHWGHERDDRLRVERDGFIGTRGFAVFMGDETVEPLPRREGSERHGTP